MNREEWLRMDLESTAERYIDHYLRDYVGDECMQKVSITEIIEIRKSVMEVLRVLMNNKISEVVKI